MIIDYLKKKSYRKKYEKWQHIDMSMLNMAFKYVNEDNYEMASKYLKLNDKTREKKMYYLYKSIGEDPK